MSGSLFALYHVVRVTIGGNMCLIARLGYGLTLSITTTFLILAVTGCGQKQKGSITSSGGDLDSSSSSSSSSLDELVIVNGTNQMAVEPDPPTSVPSNSELLADAIIVDPGTTTTIPVPDNCVEMCMIENQDAADPDICNTTPDGFDDTCASDCEKNICQEVVVKSDPTNVSSFTIPAGAKKLEVEIAACVKRAEVLMISSALSFFHLSGKSIATVGNKKGGRKVRASPNVARARRCPDEFQFRAYVTVDGEKFTWSHPEYSVFPLVQRSVIDPEDIEPGSSFYWVPKYASLKSGFIAPGVLNNWATFDPMEPGEIGKQLLFKTLFQSRFTSIAWIRGDLYYVERKATSNPLTPADLGFSNLF